MKIQDISYYKPNVDKTALMLKKLYRDAVLHKGGNVTLRTLPDSDIKVYLDLTNYDYSNDFNQYVADLLRGHIDMMEQRKSVDDNFFPNFNINMGIGDYSAFVTGDIVFNKETSWSTPSLKNLEDYKSFEPIGSSLWYRRYMIILEELLKQTSESGIPFCRGFFSPLDLAESLRGEHIYYDFYDEPEKLHELLDYCADVTIHFAEDIYALIKKYRKGSKYGTFYSEGMINMSEDIACMISDDLYREFCAPHTQKVIDHFGVGHMHCHSRAMYLVKEICSLKNVANLWLATDPNQPRPFDCLEQLIKDANGVCLAIDCENFEEIEKNKQILKQGNFSICLPVKTCDEAIDCVNRFNKLFD